jgi:sugar-specific transcriptional regulator TrmB
LDNLIPTLEALGLTPNEAAVYVSLVVRGAAGAQSLAETTGVPRSSVYQILRVLRDRGLAESTPGYGARFKPIPPHQAIPDLIEQHRQRLLEQERLAKQVVEQLAELAPSEGPIDEDVVEILYNPRVVAERWKRLQLEAESEIEVFVKAPIVATKPADPLRDEVLARGVKVRGLYEESFLDQDGWKDWIHEGEENRAFAGELPLKLALIDRRAALLPLITPSERQGMTSILIRHEHLGAGLHMLFDCLWRSSTPLVN